MESLTPIEREKKAVRMWLELMRCTKTLEAQVSSKMRGQFGQSFSRFDVLSQLYRAPDTKVSITELASDLLAATSRNITGLIDRMEKDGLVVREAHPKDKRSFTVALTESGKNLFMDMAAEHSKWVLDIFGSVTDETLAIMLGGVTEVRKSIELNSK